MSAALSVAEDSGVGMICFMLGLPVLSWHKINGGPTDERQNTKIVNSSRAFSTSSPSDQIVTEMVSTASSIPLEYAMAALL